MKFWTTLSFKKKLTGTTIFFGVIILFAYFGIQLYFIHLESHSICWHSKYKLIHHDLTKEEVVKILGSPDKIIVKSNINDYTFGQGEKDSKIKEGWIYQFFGWDGSIEVYFDQDSVVNGKNCGHG
ncbi:hypothetical protein KAI65_04955 [Candidatus Parcubacteria bacterium]|nr:hypothetical protein [Candidatus Parcubacteria bacterium]